MASSISTHILDTARGCPAAGVPVHLAQRDGSGAWHDVARSVTDDDGRITSWPLEGSTLDIGTYRLTFEVAGYFAAQGTSSFYSSIPIVFEVEHSQHYHVPLLLSPFGYSTYRGS